MAQERRYIKPFSEGICEALNSLSLQRILIKKEGNDSNAGEISK
jgi:hypothetical protein